MNIQQNISLKHFNTFGIDVQAKYFAVFNNPADLPGLFGSDALKMLQGEYKITVLGGGSNMLFTKNVSGLVLKNEITGIEKIGEDAAHVYIKAGAGENWHLFVLYCLENNYAGVENLALIPGSIWASPMQNVGAYGVEIKDVFQSLEAFDVIEKCFVSFNKSDCAFGYRESVFKKQHKDRFIIISVTFKLNKTPVFNVSYGAVTQELTDMRVADLSIQAIAQAVMNIRSSKLPDPKLIGNAGSFFKNPEIDLLSFEKLQVNFPGIAGFKLDGGNIKLAAGWLIEQCGWKGYRKGDAGCFAKQALVLVNYGNANGMEIYDLSTEIIQTVFNTFGVQLEREVNIL